MSLITIFSTTLAQTSCPDVTEVTVAVKTDNSIVGTLETFTCSSLAGYVNDTDSSARFLLSKIEEREGASCTAVEGNACRANCEISIVQSPGDTVFLIADTKVQCEELGGQFTVNLL